MSEFYILDEDNRPHPAELMEWGRFFNDIGRRRVAETLVDDGVRISTVFLGINHRLFGNGPPLIFETMIFGGPLDGGMWRYSTWDDAEVGHEMAVKKAQHGSE
jgi:hypothetical protein